MFEAFLNSDSFDEQLKFLDLFSQKEITSDSLVALVKAIRGEDKILNIPYPTLDIVGTGGDGQKSLNISTASALLLSQCGVPILKGGNRAVSSQSGAADVLEALGYKINLKSTEEILKSLAKNNFAFCLVSNFYPVFNKIRAVRKKLGRASIFNLIGPLLNPAGLDFTMIGIYDPKYLKIMAEALLKLGSKKALVYHGNLLDELSCLGKIQAYLVEAKAENQIKNLEIDPAKLGLSTCSMSDLRGYDAPYNARVIYKSLGALNLASEKTGLTDTLLLNAGVGLFIYGKAQSIGQGIEFARTRLSQGNVLLENKLLEILIRKEKKLNVASGDIFSWEKTKSFKQALLEKKSGAVIAEIKRASPSLGPIATIKNPVERAMQYVNAGAAVISVLTDEGFEGDLEDLKIVSEGLRNTAVPVLCKDFIFTPAQLLVAKQKGADVVLLMVSVLGERVKSMVKIAQALGLETLVEIHSEAELNIALDSGSDVLGVNQRDLKDFSMHPELLDSLMQLLKNQNQNQNQNQNILIIAESGIKTPEDANKYFSLGYHGVLVGEALSRLDVPESFFKKLNINKYK